MKLDKKIIITAIICFLISGTIGVVAYSVTASNVSFTPDNSEWQVDNVEDAVNDLYEKNDSTTLTYNIGSNKSSFTKYQTRIVFPKYKIKYKYFKITKATPVTSQCSNIYLGSTVDLDSGNLSIGTEYLTSIVGNCLTIYTTGSTGCFYDVEIDLYN